MSGSRAKKIRKDVYGDHAHRNTSYTITGTSTVICTGLRADYLKAKAVYKKG